MRPLPETSAICAQNVRYIIIAWNDNVTQISAFPADDPRNHKILMVLEYVEGNSLFSGTKLAPKKQLSEIQARKYFRDVLQVDLLPDKGAQLAYQTLSYMAQEKVWLDCTKADLQFKRAIWFSWACISVPKNA